MFFKTVAASVGQSLLEEKHRKTAGLNCGNAVMPPGDGLNTFFRPSAMPAFPPTSEGGLETQDGHQSDFQYSSISELDF